LEFIYIFFPFFSLNLRAVEDMASPLYVRGSLLDLLPLGSHPLFPCRAPVDVEHFVVSVFRVLRRSLQAGINSTIRLPCRVFFFKMVRYRNSCSPLFDNGSSCFFCSHFFEKKKVSCTSALVRFFDHFDHPLFFFSCFLIVERELMARILLFEAAGR